MRGGGLHYSLQGVVKCTLAFPFFAFILCVVWSLLFDFDAKSSTHCEVDEFLPSLSSVIGGNLPQKYVWSICIALHSAPRFLFAALYKNIFQDRLNLGVWTPHLIRLNFGCNLIENLCLVGLSFVSSTEIFIFHEIFFICFLGTYVVSMTLTVLYLVPHCGFQAKSFAEKYSLKIKKRILKGTFISLFLALYFYWRHNEYCEPYVYSFFGLFEYLIILGNMAYHGLAYLDFQDFSCTVGTNQILVR